MMNKLKCFWCNKRFIDLVKHTNNKHPRLSPRSYDLNKKDIIKETIVNWFNLRLPYEDRYDLIEVLKQTISKAVPKLEPKRKIYGMDIIEARYTAKDVREICNQLVNEIRGRIGLDK